MGTIPEGKERAKDKTSRKHRSRIGSALVCVRRNVQDRELKLPDSSRFVLSTVAMVSMSASGPTGCLVSPCPVSSQEVQPYMNSPASHRARGETQTMSLALGANPESNKRVKDEASRIQVAK